MSNIGVTSVVLGEVEYNQSDGSSSSASTLSASGKYTKLFYNYYNTESTEQTVEIVNFPVSFFRIVNYQLVTRTISSNTTSYKKATLSSGTYMFDEQPAGSLISPYLFQNTVNNSTVGGLVLDNVIGGNTTTSICEVVIENDTDRITLSLKSLGPQEKASVMIELF